MNILIPVVVVVLLGLVASIILTIASKLMYVPVDQRVLDLREALPGANCGACGFAGCDDYAAAMGEDSSISAALCPVGGKDLAEELSGILGVEAEIAEPKVATVMCKGNSSVTSNIMELGRDLTCKSAAQFYGGHWACLSGCLGLGDCKAVCDYDAIKIQDGLAVIDREKCVACGVCTAACPKNLIAVQTKKNAVYVGCSSTATGAKTRKSCQVGCIGCRKCEKACKFEAITVEDNLAKIDPEKCKNCGLCVKECPTNAIADLRSRKKNVKTDLKQA